MPVIVVIIVICNCCNENKKGSVSPSLIYYDALLSHGRDDKAEGVVLILYHILIQRQCAPRVDTTQALLLQVEAEIGVGVGFQIA